MFLISFNKPKWPMNKECFYQISQIQIRWSKFNIIQLFPTWFELLRLKNSFCSWNKPDHLFKSFLEIQKFVQDYRKCPITQIRMSAFQLVEPNLESSWVGWSHCSVHNHWQLSRSTVWSYGINNCERRTFVLLTSHRFTEMSHLELLNFTRR